jgi:hypothetical protein
LGGSATSHLYICRQHLREQGELSLFSGDRQQQQQQQQAALPVLLLAT